LVYITKEGDNERKFTWHTHGLYISLPADLSALAQPLTYLYDMSIRNGLCVLTWRSGLLSFLC